MQDKKFRITTHRGTEIYCVNWYDQILRVQKTEGDYYSTLYTFHLNDGTELVACDSTEYRQDIPFKVAEQVYEAFSQGSSDIEDLS